MRCHVSMLDDCGRLLHVGGDVTCRYRFRFVESRDPTVLGAISTSHTVVMFSKPCWQTLSEMIVSKQLLCLDPPKTIHMHEGHRMLRVDNRLDSTVVDVLPANLCLLLQNMGSFELLYEATSIEPGTCNEERSTLKEMYALLYAY